MATYIYAEKINCYYYSLLKSKNSNCWYYIRFNKTLIHIRLRAMTEFDLKCRLQKFMSNLLSAFIFLCVKRFLCFMK
jgi:hypothetical protein